MGPDPTRNATDDDPQARYEALVVPHLDRLLAFARRRTESLADAEDAVQEACARARPHRVEHRSGDARLRDARRGRRTGPSWP